MADTDSLEIKIKAEAEKAEAALDKLIEKLTIISSKLGSTENKTKDFGGIKKASSEAKKAVEQMSDSAKKNMDNVAKSTQKVAESIEDMQARIMKTAKEKVNVAVDTNVSTDKLELQIRNWKSKLITAQNEWYKIAASEDVSTQSKGMARYAATIAQAEKALELLNSEEKRRNDELLKEREESWKKLLEKSRKEEENKKGIDYYEKNLNWYDANIQDYDTKGYYFSGLQQSFQQLKKDFPDAEQTIKDYKDLIEDIEKKFPHISSAMATDPGDIEKYMENSAYGDLKKITKKNTYEKPELKNGEKYTSAYKDLQVQIEKTSIALDKLLVKKQRFEDTGVSKNAQKYKDLEWNINHVTEGYNKLVDSASQMETAGDAIESIEKPASGLYSVFEKLSSVSKTVASALRGMGFGQVAARVQSAGQNLSNMSASMTEVATTSEAAGTAMAGLETAIPVIGIVLAGVTVLINAFRKFASVVSKIAQSIVGFFRKISDAIKNIIKQMLSLGKTSNQSSNKLLRGVQRIFMALASRLRSMAVTATTDSMGDSFDNLQKHSSRLNDQMMRLKVTLQLIGGQFVAAFEPVMNYVLPAVNALASGILGAVNALSQLIAALSGQSTYIQATANMDAFADSASGASKAQKDLNKQLQSFDELNNITTNDGSGRGSGSGNNSNKGTGFEDADIPDNIKKLSERIKEAWESGNFYSLGKDLGTELAAQLDSINWSAIKEKAKKIGKSIGTFISGFVSADDLSSSIGNTIGEAINTVNSNIGAFLESTDFKAVGEFFSKIIQSSVSTIDWNQILQNGINAGKGIADFINGIFSVGTTESIATAIYNVINSGIAGFEEMANTLDYKQIGDSIIVGIKTALLNFDRNKLKSGLQRMAKGLAGIINNIIDSDAIPVIVRFIYDNVNTITNTLSEFINDVNWTKLAGDLMKAIQSLIYNVDWKALGNILGKMFMNLMVVLRTAITNPVTWISIRLAFDTMLYGALSGIGSTLSNIFSNAWVYIKEGLSKAWSIVLSWWQGATILNIRVASINLVDTVRNAWNNLQNWARQNMKLNLHVEFTTPVGTIQKSVTKALHLTGWPNLKFFKYGGYPDMGDLFVANEAGPELVGTVNGKSAVASNNEITGIRDAIYDSSQQELAMLRRQNDLLMQIVQKEFGITDSEIFNSVKKSNRQYYNQSGRNALVY